MKNKHCSLLFNFSVKRGAECNTDHQLLRLKLRISKLYSKSSRVSRLSTMFDVSKLTGPIVDENGKDTPRGAFQDLASSLIVDNWKEDGSVNEKWNAVHSALTGAAKTVLGERVNRVHSMHGVHRVHNHTHYFSADMP